MGIERALVHVVDENGCVTGWALMTKPVESATTLRVEALGEGTLPPPELTERLFALERRMIDVEAALASHTHESATPLPEGGQNNEP